MPPLGRKDHKIGLEQAVEMTRRHRQNMKKPHEFRAGAYDKTQMLELLNQKGCAGIRIYLARDAKGDSTYVAVGVDASGEDMTSGTILEETWICPPYCATSSPLNA